jgi:hypothetical protein
MSRPVAATTQLPRRDRACTAGIHSGRLHPAVRDGADGDVHCSVHCYADHDRSTRSCLARHGQHTCHQNLSGDTDR